MITSNAPASTADQTAAGSAPACCIAITQGSCCDPEVKSSCCNSSGGCKC